MKEEMCKCSFCKKERRTAYLVHGGTTDENGDPCGGHGFFWCKGCYSDEWDSNMLMFESREAAGEAWERRYEEQNETKKEKIY